MPGSESTEPTTAPRGHALGFGCASLYGLPGRRERRAVLESAYDLGIRHFDVAPIYGLGIAEAELGDFAQAHNDIRIATKFGIRPTVIGRMAGFVQPPVRRMLQTSTTVKSKVKQSGAAPDAGVVGRVLYSRGDYSVAAAKRALLSSLRVLRTARIDYFLLHEPHAVLADDYQDLVDYLETQRSRDVIGCWGPAGDLSRADDASVATLSARAPALQCPYDLIAGYRGPQPERDRLNITFGFLAEALPRVIGVMSSEPEFRAQCSELLDADLGDPRTVLRLLVRDAVAHNPSGTVLVSSTKIKNLEMTCGSVDVALRNEVQVANMIRDCFLGVRAAR
ncbi:aldo/keto reductase [Mycobacterium cookii]|nr:aldo/keto reductase [Mycobacterium cookii]